MNNKEILTSVVMLETVWKTRKKDIVDLISPFVEYAVAKYTSEGSVIDVSKVLNYMRDHYGYSDIPVSIINKVFNRNKEYFQNTGKGYKLAKNLDTVAQKMDEREAQCEKTIATIGDNLAKYLNEHCLCVKNYSQETAINALNSFFKQYGLYAGTGTLASNAPEYTKSNESNYYISKYILECKQKHSSDYNSIIDLNKGYFLKTAIYLQPENGNLTTARYSDLSFYYDTPFLLGLLGYLSEEQNNSAKELHSKLKSLGGKFSVFRHTVEELCSVLTAYKYSISGNRSSSHITLEGLDRLKYGVSDVERIISKIDDTVKHGCNCQIADIPCYKTSPDGTVDIDSVLPEEDIKNYIRKNTRHYKENSLIVDVDSALAIHRLRDNVNLSDIEKAKAVFVTTNIDFTRAFNSYYKKYVSSKAFQLVISAYELSALTWVKAGIMGTLAETQLLTNAYTAMQPLPELIDNFISMLNKMESEGKVTYEEAVILRTERYFKNMAWESTFGAEVTEELIAKMKEKLKDGYISEYTAEQENRLKEETNERIERAINKAKIKAEKERGVFEKFLQIVFVLMEIILSFLSLKYLHEQATIEKVTFPSILYLLISSASLIDTIHSKGFLIRPLIKKIASRFETCRYEKYKKNYLDIVK